MKTTAIAAGLSLALHLAVLVFFAQETAHVSPVAVPSAKPVQVEVMRTGLISPHPKVVGVEAPSPVKRPAAPKAAAGRGFESRRAESDEPEDEIPGAAQPASDAPLKEPGGTGTSEATGPAVAAGPSGSTGAIAADPLDTAALSRRLQQVALRCYPAAARRFRQTGEAQIRFCLDGAGALKESTVIRSAGSELLDHAATDCVVPGAAPFGPETFGRCFTVPVRFNP